MRYLIQSYLSILCLACMTASAAAQEPTDANEGTTQETTLQVRGQSFFTDRLIQAYTLFDAEVDAPERPYPTSKFVQIISIEIEVTPDSDQSKSIAVIQFLVRESGLVELPALQFSSENTTYQTAPLSIRVQTPLESEQMTLSLEPAKHRVYVGEPLRINLTWQADDLNASNLKALRLYPEFFDNPDLEVVIPRNTEPDDKQVGLPIGGRRVIATRSKVPDQPKQLGTISLPIYLQFKTPGIHTLPETYLECAALEKTSYEFARYAAYFNNALFEMPDRDDVYQRIFTRAPANSIEVLALPEAEKRASFSGLFDPIEIEVSSDQEEVSIGELMELKVLLKSPAPHGMLELPELGRQANLRERFVIDADHGRLWHPEGSEFRIRIRPLTTTIRAIPSLNFQIFNPETGQFQMQHSEPIPLKVNPVNGADYIPLGSIEGATVPLTSQPEGIWHNLTKHPMNDLLNILHHFANTYFWWLILMGPIGYILLRPVFQRWQRRKTDPQYRECVQAYAEFKRAPSNAPEKWQAFVGFLARSYGGNAKAWTRHDSEYSLRSSGLEEKEIQIIVALHEAADANDYGGKDTPVAFQKLDGLAKRIRKLKIASAILLLIALSMCALPQVADANSWDEAEALWTEAQESAAGSDPAINLYQQAALKFQAAAVFGQNTGEAWYNAGNAWFQAGAIGRAIAAYRQATVYLPFDPNLTDNLAAARALTMNQIPSEKSWWQRIPKAWAASTLVVLNIIFWSLLLLSIRFRTRRWRITTTASAALVLIASALLLQKQLSSEQSGVVVVDETLSKKGPGYAYADAFQEPLHDGLEFTLREQRDSWGRIELPDGRECWLPLEQAQLIQD